MNLMVNLACQLDGIWNPLDESVRAFPGKVKCGEQGYLLLSNLDRKKPEQKAVMCALLCVF